MPSDAVTVAVTAGLGVSVVVGVVSGLCYVLVQGYGKKRNRKELANPWRCAVCGSYFRSIDGILEATNVVTCHKCQARVCRSRCSEREYPTEGWTCNVCRKESESWFKGILGAIQPNFQKGVHLRTKMSNDRLEEIDEDLEKLRKKEKEHVRDFIERLVSTMLGGDVDDTCVTKLYNDSHYETMFCKYHSDLSTALTDLGSALHVSIANLPITGQSPCSAHAALKQLIQRIILDALDLPRLRASEDLPEESHEVHERTYEDLLATAVLNKVIQKYQEDRPSSSGNSVCSRHSKSPRGKEYFFGKETLDTKYKNSRQDPETDSLSSLDDMPRSECSLGSHKSDGHMTLTISQSIVENASNSEDSEEDPEPLYVRTTSSLFGGDETVDFEDNWTLQKRKYTSSNSPVPVPMLVPNPTTDAKVFIGDKEAENTSDLSDAASDYEEVEVIPTINSILVDSKTVIGGKNLMRFDNVNAEKEEKTVVVNGHKKPTSKVNGAVAQKETVDNGIVLTGEGVEEHSLLSLDSNTEQDTEYTEKYASLPRTILKSPLAKPRIPKPSVEQQQQMEERNLNGGENEFEFPTKGTYSEREKEKWKHPIPMKYNPYSRENIERRLSTRSSCSSISSQTMSTSLAALLDEDRKKIKNHRFGRDYYIREASKPEGARKAKSDIGDTNAENHIATLTSPSADETRYSDFLVKAVPVNIQDEKLSSQPSSLNLDNKNVIEISSDSDLSIERVYNPPTGKITEKITTDLNQNDVKTNETKRQFLRSLTLSEDDFPQQVKSPADLTYDDFVVFNNVEENLVPSKIQKYEQINDSTKQLSQSSSNLTSTPTPAPRNFHIQRTHDEPKVMILSEDLVDSYRESKQNGAGDSKTPDFSEEELNFSGSTPDISFDHQSSRAHSSLEANAEISCLQEKHLVKHILGEFSRSFPNLTKISDRNSATPPPEISRSADTSLQEINEELSVLPSVRDLKKKFEATATDRHVKQDSKIVYSLTARSIPRQFRQELKNQEEIQTPIHSSLDADKVISHENGASDHIPTARNTIEFFENLGRRKDQDLEKST